MQNVSFSTDVTEDGDRQVKKGGVMLMALVAGVHDAYD
jgi:hypothetical protein